jgi:ABC-type nitrate/sulfonate/bicarbonate transport system substrate-binding protein
MTADPTLIRLAGAAQGFNWLPILVAERTGLFTDYGIQIELLKLGSVDKATAAVKDGSADLAVTPPEGAIADYLAGGPLRIVASNSERLPMSLVARPGITTLADLRGRRLGTSSLAEGTAIYTQRMLSAVGLRYPADYEFVLAGVHTTRWKALQDDEIDAAPQPAPWNFLAERAGYNLLGEVAEVLPEIVFGAVIGHTGWLTGHRDTVTRALDVIARGHALVNDPRNDSVTLPVYQSVTTPDDAELAARGLDYTRNLGMWPEDARISPSAFAATVDVMISTGLIADSQRAAADGVIDNTYQKA